MAVDAFDIQVQALLGIGDTTLTSIQSRLDTWLCNGYKEIVNVLPPYMYDSIAEESSVTDATALKDMTTSKILSVMRMSPSGYKPCRQVGPDMRGRVEDEDDLHYATVDDPVWFWGDQGNLTVKPNSADILIRHINYPTNLDANTDSTVADLPDEAEPALVLYVAIKAGEYMLANEEDIELLVPIIANLKDDYMKSINGLKGITATQ
tara:strand:+ start:126 stop:746 length:621 start_codon:yes stop_codon:yes gene_type:complete